MTERRIEKGFFRRMLAWYKGEAAGVRAAAIAVFGTLILATGTVLGLSIAALINVAHQRSELSAQNRDLEAVNKSKDSEIARLTEDLRPFRFEALQRFGGDDREALRKYGEFIVELKARDLEQAERINALNTELARVSEKAAAIDFKPLQSELRAGMIDKFRLVSQELSEKGIKVSVSQETWTPGPTKKFVEQLVNCLTEAGIDVEGPEYQTRNPWGPVYPLVWGFNTNQADSFQLFFGEVSRVLKSQDARLNRRLPQGKIDLHFSGTASFDNYGIATIR